MGYRGGKTRGSPMSSLPRFSSSRIEAAVNCMVTDLRRNLRARSVGNFLIQIDEMYASLADRSTRLFLKGLARHFGLTGLGIKSETGADCDGALLAAAQATRRKYRPRSSRGRKSVH